MATEFKNEIRQVKKLYREASFFQVIIVTVELLTRISDFIMESMESLAEEEAQNEDDHLTYKNIYEIYGKSLRKIKGDDAPRAKIQRIFVEYVSHEGFEGAYSRKDTVEILHRIERVVSFRNDLAHSYFDKNKNVQKRLRLMAEECQKLTLSVKKHPWFS